MLQTKWVASGMRSIVALLVVSCGLGCTSSLSFAQNTKKTTQPVAAKNNGPETTSYDKELFRLSELLGVLGYLHPLCSDTQSTDWSQRMQILADAEGNLNPRRRDMITGAYNKGFRNYSLTYYSCTPHAHAIIAQSTTEAEKLSKRLSSRYGG